jgi:hypothetical protein
MDGPVIKAAQRALRTGNLNHVLIWVQEPVEGEIRKLFGEVRKVRTLSPRARDLADMYFYETVVRLHRAGEGEPYTGLKPTGTEEAKIFVELDDALTGNLPGKLSEKIPAAQRAEFEARFRDVAGKRKFGVNDVKAGRQYVASYVAFLHWFETLEG